MVSPARIQSEALTCLFNLITFINLILLFQLKIAPHINQWKEFCLLIFKKTAS